VDPGNEKRRVARTQVKWSVTIQTSKGTISTEVRDISVEGAFIRALNPLDLGEVFKIFIKVPTLDNPLLVDAQVVWTCNRKFDQVVASNGMGVKFIQITARDRNLLNEVISTQPYPGNMSQ
jgi:Tfp pilus assembly protein PilZ